MMQSCEMQNNHTKNSSGPHRDGHLFLDKATRLHALLLLSGVYCLWVNAKSRTTIAPSFYRNVSLTSAENPYNHMLEVFI